ncbi:LPXTG cell wall anchor domain-containing protein [Streptococcus infantis]
MVESTGNLEKQLPNTGSEDSNSSVLLGGLAAITGISLFAKRRKDENEDEI